MIDARGLACPMPVLMTQKEISKNAPANLEVLVDHHAARENVKRFAEAAGYSVEVKEEDEGNLQLSLEGTIDDEIIDTIKNLDINTITPLEALTTLHDLVKKARGN